MTKVKGIFIILIVGSFLFSPSPVVGKTGDQDFNYGVRSLVVDLDPHFAWDSASMDLIDQVCEGLFGYNLTDPEMAIIPVLAASMGTWNAEATEYTVPLKQNVTFHDGSAFTSADVKWSFDRLIWLIENEVSQLADVYSPSHNSTDSSEKMLIFKEILAPTDYEVTFVLNYAFVPLVSLLCFSGSVILPSNAGYATDTSLDTTTGVLIGTGPYQHIETTEEHTRLEYYPTWHGTRPANLVENIMFLYYADGIGKNQDFLDGRLDWVDAVLPEFTEQFNASKYFELGAPQRGTATYYLGMNNTLINKTMRQAISYAIDYDYIYEELGSGNIARRNSPLPEEHWYYNPDLIFPSYNVTQARTILLNAGIVPAGTNLTDDQWWRDTANNHPIATYNYTWNIGNEFQGNFGNLTLNNLCDIGVKVVLEGWSDWGWLDEYNFNTYNNLQLFVNRWDLDYNDPSNFINPLFSNISTANLAQVNDSTLQGMMKEGLADTNETTRQDLYFYLQEYIVEDLMPVVFLYARLSPSVRSVTIDGILRNSMNKICLANMFWTGIAGPRYIDIPELLLMTLRILGAVAVAIVIVVIYRKIRNYREVHQTKR